jgi:hypothetical protein
MIVELLQVKRNRIQGRKIEVDEETGMKAILRTVK